MDNPLDSVLESMEELLKLEPGEVERGNELGKKIVDEMADLKEVISEEGALEKYEGIYASLKNRSSELSRDIVNSRGGPLSSDWEQFAKNDMMKFKDEVLALQEFLTARKGEIRNRLIEESYGLDLRDLANRLRGEEAVDGVVRSQFLSRIEEMDEEELREKTEEFEESLERISKWLLALDGIRSEGMHVE